MTEPLVGIAAIVVAATRPELRCVALVLGGLRAKVVVTGDDEAGLAELVGEIACGAGTARHVLGSPDAATLQTAIARAEALGRGPHVVVAAADEGWARDAAIAPLHVVDASVCDVPTATAWIAKQRWD